jgi:formylmethanofuran dehydrogenase subunit E
METLNFERCGRPMLLLAQLMQCKRNAVMGEKAIVGYKILKKELEVKRFFPPWRQMKNIRISVRDCIQPAYKLLHLMGEAGGTNRDEALDMAEYFNKMEKLISAISSNNECYNIERLRNDIRSKYGALDDGKNEIVKCDDCNLHYMVEDCTHHNDGMLCSDCIDNYTWSEYMDKYILCDDVRYYYNDSGENHVITLEFARRNDLHYWVSDELYHDYEEEEEEDEGLIDGYHSNIDDIFNYMTQENIEKSKDYMVGRGCGLEIEVESSDEPKESAMKFKQKNERDFFELQHDGSLSNGFEIITRVLTYKLAEKWINSLNVADCNIYSFKSSNTGVHIHIGANDWGADQVATIKSFVEKNELFFSVIAGRGKSSYSKFFKKSKKEVEKDIKNRTLNRYSAVNLCNYRSGAGLQERNTIEFRIFKGNLKKTALLRYLDCAYSVCDYCTNSPRPTLSGYKKFVAKEKVRVFDGATVIGETLKYKTLAAFVNNFDSLLLDAVVKSMEPKKDAQD